MAIIDHDQGDVALGPVPDFLEPGDSAVHAEGAIGGDQPVAGIGRLLQLLLQVGHVGVLVDGAPSLAEPDPIDNARMVELVGEDHVFLREEGFEYAAVGIEAGRVENRVFGLQEFRQPALQQLVTVLGAADETYAAAPAPLLVEALPCSLDNGGVARESKVVVGAEVDDLSRGSAGRMFDLDQGSLL